MPQQRRRADALRNSDRIVRAAITALQETGPTVPLEEIARRAGLGIATVYRRFGDRDGVIRAAFETYFAEEVEPLARAARTAADPRQGLATALAATVDTLAAHRRLLAAAREAGAFTVGLAERFVDPLGDVLTAAQRRGLIRTDLLVRDLAAIVVMALGTVHPGDDGGRPEEDGADHRRYLALLLDGTRPSAEPLPRPSSHRLFADDTAGGCAADRHR
ncbi:MULTISPECIES: TetR/AcrR family transcriptional regulator [Streptosporangium]|uniref:AcrR family transcriptional regulator n=1 Tax=Streptosporangium brasiliense TaxID=47480 RepID=A0ABT9RAJ8_9ACTN|nr:TetR/AcrR family transcriptional regulator [Streptosporangium brasiliense]MDP9866280.1 AcrR family transcriptional regulator [Streptosporangium brasiliense]